MNKLRTIFLAILAVPVFLILIWFLAVPDDLIQEQIDDALIRSGNSNMDLSINGLRKGLLFSLYADNIHLQIDNKPALDITDFTGNFSPRYLADRNLAFSINAKIGTGNVNGVLKLPLAGNINIDKVELSAITYLSRFGIDVSGNLSSDITINKETVHVVFEIPDLDISESALSAVPFLNTFHKMQGAVSIKNNEVKLDSVSLEGEIGYARLKGNIKNGVMNMDLEIMPLKGRLSQLESILISKYLASPGYYVIPIKGPLP